MKLERPSEVTEVRNYSMVKFKKKQDYIPSRRFGTVGRSQSTRFRCAYVLYENETVTDILNNRDYDTPFPQGRI